MSGCSLTGVSPLSVVKAASVAVATAAPSNIKRGSSAIISGDFTGTESRRFWEEEKGRMRLIKFFMTNVKAESSKNGNRTIPTNSCKWLHYKCLQAYFRRVSKNTYQNASDGVAPPAVVARSVRDR